MPHDPEKKREYFRSHYKRNRAQKLEYTKRWRVANPELVREWTWKSLGICLTFSEYAAMRKAQHNACAICQRAGCDGKGNRNRRHLDVDHNHETGQVRALLCRLCNVRLGLYEAGRQVQHPDVFLKYLQTYDRSYQLREA